MRVAQLIRAMKAWLILSSFVISTKIPLNKIIVRVMSVRGSNHSLYSTDWRQPCSTWINLCKPKYYTKLKKIECYSIKNTKKLMKLQLVRFCVYCRIKPHAPPLVQTSVNSFEFHPCERTTPAECLRVSWHTLVSNTHRLLHGLPGSLIPFDSHASVPQRQYKMESCLRRLVVPSKFLLFISTLKNPHISSHILKFYQLS